MEEIKTQLNDLISGGKVRKALKLLQSLDLESGKKDKIAAIGSRYSRFIEEKNQGIITHEQASVTENKIVTSLIEIVKNLDQKEPVISEESKSNTMKYALYSIIGLAVVLFVLFQLKAFGSSSENLQLTVFVVDEEGNPALVNEGKINIPLGNRALNSMIGPNGRINFGDITKDNVGDSITIGLDAKGWEIVGGKNRFSFNGDPIEVIVAKDATLGIIKGVIKSRDGQTFIENASISIGADTIITTNAAGVFNTVLPTRMRVLSETTPYNLTISAPGYKTTTQFYYPGQSTEIRLNKN